MPIEARTRISTRAKYIYDTYYKPVKVRSKSELLKFEIGDYVERNFDNPKFTFTSGSYKVDNLCESYFYDVIRFKEYHMIPEGSPDMHSKLYLDGLHLDDDFAITEKRIKRINYSKIATLTAKWFLKNLPIYLVPTPDVAIDKDNNYIGIDGDDFKLMSYANEAFLLSHICDILAIEPLNLNKQEAGMLIYTFKYRNFDADAFYIIFDRLWEQFGDKAQIMGEG